MDANISLQYMNGSSVVQDTNLENEEENTKNTSKPEPSANPRCPLSDLTTLIKNKPPATQEGATDKHTVQLVVKGNELEKKKDDAPMPSGEDNPSNNGATVAGNSALA